MPVRIEECYCGAKKPDPSRAKARRPRAKGESAAAIKLGLAGLALVLLGAGAWFTRDHEAASPSAPAQQPAAPTSAAQPRATAGKPAAVSAVDEPGAPPLADMVEQAMRGIVLVESLSTGTSGSGFFAAPDLIVTNAHVLAGSMTASITLRGGAHTDGRVVSVSPSKDLAFLQIPKSEGREVALPFSRSATLRLGQSIVALGWAQDLSQTSLRVGLVTGIGRDLEHDRILIQTSADANPGDSGGPLVDRSGRVVGITVGRIPGNAASGVAVAVDETRQFLERIPSNTVAGSSSASSISTPTPSSTPPQPPPTLSATDQLLAEAAARREAGTKQYDQQLSALESVAANLDAIWRSYRTQCGITSVPGGQSHEWFVLYDPRSPLHQTAPYCARALSDVEQQARSIGAAMATAEETARRNGVFAGDLRSTRARHRLDYSGWDR